MVRVHIRLFLIKFSISKIHFVDLNGRHKVPIECAFYMEVTYSILMVSVFIKYLSNQIIMYGILNIIIRPLKCGIM